MSFHFLVLVFNLPVYRGEKIEIFLKPKNFCIFFINSFLLENEYTPANFSQILFSLEKTNAFAP